jgi:hypothetical protein
VAIVKEQLRILRMLKPAGAEWAYDALVTAWQQSPPLLVACGRVLAVLRIGAEVFAVGDVLEGDGIGFVAGFDQPLLFLVAISSVFQSGVFGPVAFCLGSQGMAFDERD